MRMVLPTFLTLVFTLPGFAEPNRIGPWQVADGPAVNNFQPGLDQQRLRALFRQGLVPRAGSTTWSVAPDVDFLDYRYGGNAFGYAQKFLTLKGDRSASLRIHPGGHRSVIAYLQNGKFLTGRCIAVASHGRGITVDISVWLARGQNRLVLSVVGAKGDTPVRAELIFPGKVGGLVCMKREEYVTIIERFDKGVLLLIKQREEEEEARREARRNRVLSRLLHRQLYLQQLQAIQRQRLYSLQYLSSPYYSYSTTSSSYTTYEIVYTYSSP